MPQSLTASKISSRAFTSKVKKHLPPGHSLVPNRRNTWNAGSVVYKGYDVLDPDGTVVARGVLTWDKNSPSMGEFRRDRVLKGRTLDEGTFSGFMASRLESVVEDWLYNLNAAPGRVTRVGARNITASDRKSLIRLASSLPQGSPERKAILAGLKKTSAEEWPNGEVE